MVGVLFRNETVQPFLHTRSQVTVIVFSYTSYLYIHKLSMKWKGFHSDVQYIRMNKDTGRSFYTAQNQPSASHPGSVLMYSKNLPNAPAVVIKII